MAFFAGQKLRASDLNNITFGAEQGEWTILANLALSTPTLINNWTPYVGTNPATISGISHSSGVFTVTRGGIYVTSLAIRYSATTADRYCFIAGTGSSDIWAKSSTPSAASGINTSCAVTKRIAAGGTIRMYGYAGSATNAIHESGAELVTGCTIYYAGP
ncbi:hypothetical protein [Amycolatopsis sp. WQ 127309]|uniref:hypothetical protein n=1 Tax=Amycolatopsis sp. WQ 127309 TaxID=2932773 RepID=UPI001FF40BB7|nr:hypothetical protein [Amycolatopsis sp. WQ 127309]UOZ10551.1 hypothetical protein MUY22_20710 [Amycolatopsis sp. WQ 127309]